MPSTATAPARGESAVRPPSSKTIVVIDDLDDLAEVLLMLLNSSGYNASSAADGYSGLRLAVESNADLVIMDHLMPVMLGSEVGRALRAHTEARRAKIVFMSATPEEEIRATFQDYDAFLQKPCPPEQMLSVVAALLEANPGK